MAKKKNNNQTEIVKSPRWGNECSGGIKDNSELSDICTLMWQSISSDARSDYINEKVDLIGALEQTYKTSGLTRRLENDRQRLLT